MDNETARKKDIVKNIAIIFLVIMLILTFFSNTIMNYSLPEVSAKYAAAGTISETIRGSGTVEVEKTYDVTVEETRVIKAVYVKNGDTVAKGDKLYDLEDKESTELEEARKKLKELEADYRKALVSAEGNTGYAKELLDIENAKDELEAAEKEYNSYSDDPYDFPDVRAAQQTVKNSETTYAKYDDPDFLREKYPAEYQNIANLERDLSYLKSQAEAADFFYKNETELEILSSETDLALNCLDTEDYSPLPAEWYTEVNAAAQYVKKIEREKMDITDRKTTIEGYIAALETDDMLGLPPEDYERIKDYIKARNDAQADYDTAKADYDRIKDGNDKDKADITEKKTRIEGYIAALDTEDMLGLPADDYDRIKDYIKARNDAQAAYDSAKANYDKVSKEVGTVVDYDSEIISKQKQIREKNAELDSVNETIVTITISTDSNKYDTLNELYQKSRSIHLEITSLNEELEALLRKQSAGNVLAGKLNRASKQLDTAQTRLTNALEALNNMKKVLKDEYIAELNGVKRDIEEIEKQKSAAQDSEETSKESLETLKDRMDKAQEKLTKAKNDLINMKKVLKEEYVADLNEVKTEIEEADKNDIVTGEDGDDTVKRLDAAKTALNNVKNRARIALRNKKADIVICQKYLEKKKECDKAKSDLKVKAAGDKAALKTEIDKDKTSLESLVDEKKTQIKEKKTTLEKTVDEKRHNVKNLETELSVKRQTDGVEEKKGNIELEIKREQIADQKTEIEKLEKKSVGASITAPVGGIIRTMSYSEGESTRAGEAAAVIEMVDKGFKLTLSVKNEQAKKLQLGTSAEVASNYFGGDITAELSAIKPDKTNPQTNKTLEFRINGTDVKAGDSITVSIGAKGQDYQCVVPNTAVREDKNGKHVLVVESKSSPLGSRYYAVRYPVQVLAQNDTSTAVSGLSGSEFIVVSSSVPIEAGKQVKLSENQ